jgi:hypothetical protein
MRRTLTNEGQGAARPPERERSEDHARVAARGIPPPGKPSGVFAFRAELDVTEIDTRGRPGVVWTGRALELSRSHLGFRSRRMCYEGRELLLAVHLVDDRPVPLYGMVTKSEYDGDGLYRTTINLLPMPETESVEDWVRSLQARAQP